MAGHKAPLPARVFYPEKNLNIFFSDVSLSPFERSSMRSGTCPKIVDSNSNLHESNLNNVPHPRVWSRARARLCDTERAGNGIIEHTRPNFVLLVPGEPSSDLHHFTFFFISARAGINLGLIPDVTRGESNERINGSNAARVAIVWINLFDGGWRLQKFKGWKCSDGGEA